MACGQSSGGEALLHISGRVCELAVLLFGKCPLPKIYDLRVIETGADPYHRPSKTGTKGKYFRVTWSI